MKKVYILIPVILSLVFIAASNGVAEVQNRDRTGSPDGDNPCSQCHTSTSFAPEVNLVVTTTDGNPVTSYEPAQTYLLSLAVNATNGNPLEYGFQMSALAGGIDNLTNAGEFINLGTQVQSGTVNNAAVTDRNVIEHSSPTASGAWQAEWVAPASADVGAVTFYYSSVSANGNNNATGDSYAGGTLVLPVSDGSSVSELSNLEVRMNQTVEGVSFTSPIARILPSVEVYTSTGRLAFSAQNFETSRIIDNTDLPSGITIIVVNDGISTQTFKTLRN